MKANEGKLQSLVNIKDELAASKVQYEKRLQQYDKELYKSKVRTVTKNNYTSKGNLQTGSQLKGPMQFD